MVLETRTIAFERIREVLGYDLELSIAYSVSSTRETPWIRPVTTLPVHAVTFEPPPSPRPQSGREPIFGGVFLNAGDDYFFYIPPHGQRAHKSTPVYICPTGWDGAPPVPANQKTMFCIDFPQLDDLALLYHHADPPQPFHLDSYPDAPEF